MNTIHYHLVTNHLPIILPIAGVLVMLIGLAAKSEAVKRTAYLIFIIGALSTIVAMISGEAAEHAVEKISDVNKSYIETHENAAETFSILSYLLGGLSLIGLWFSFKQKAYSNILCIITLLFSFVVIYFGKEAGTTGGEIRHTEIRSESNQAVFESKKSKKHEDD